MERLRYNQRKMAILQLLTEVGDWVTSKEVADAFGIHPSTASHLLQRYNGHHLTERMRVSGPGPPVYAFKIGEKGRMRVIGELRRAIAQHPLPGFDTVVGRPRVLKPRVVKDKVIRPRVLDEDEVLRPRILREEN